MFSVAVILIILNPHYLSNFWEDLLGCSNIFNTWNSMVLYQIFNSFRKNDKTLTSRRSNVCCYRGTKFELSMMTSFFESIAWKFFTLKIITASRKLGDIKPTSDIKNSEKIFHTKFTRFINLDIFRWFNHLEKLTPFYLQGNKFSSY